MQDRFLRNFHNFECFGNSRGANDREMAFIFLRMGTVQDPDRERIGRIWRSVFQPEADISPITLPTALGLNPLEFQVETAVASAWLCHAVYIRNSDRRQELMASVGVHEIQHGVTKELLWSHVALQSDPDCQWVAFRGTSIPRHWIFNANTILSNWAEGGKVHGGFAQAYREVASALADTLCQGQPKVLYLTGHSLGGALALLASTRLTANAVYTFGCPRPGNPEFAARAEETPVYRVVHNQDVVTTMPYRIGFLNQFAYEHVGRPVHLCPDKPIQIDSEEQLPRSRKSWIQALHAIVEGDHPREPIPALQDHAPSRYVQALQEALT